MTIAKLENRNTIAGELGSWENSTCSPCTCCCPSQAVSCNLTGEIYLLEKRCWIVSKKTVLAYGSGVGVGTSSAPGQVTNHSPILPPRRQQAIATSPSMPIPLPTHPPQTPAYPLRTEHCQTSRASPICSKPSSSGSRVNSFSALPELEYFQISAFSS